VRVEGNNLTVEGQLDIVGKSKTIVLEGEYQGPFKDPWGMNRIGFSLQAEIDREDFGLTWNQALETGGLFVAKKVKILLEAQLVDKTSE
jgi:polyisoprenoid-binding protein YceI